jgi:hypothetical protein
LAMGDSQAIKYVKDFAVAIVQVPWTVRSTGEESTQCSRHD